MSISLHSEVKMVSLSAITIDEKENVRRKLDDIDALAEDIKQRGLLQPLVVKNGGPEDQPYRLVAGHRRAAALKKLRWGDKLVPVVVRDSETDADVDNVVENLKRKNLHVLDLAEWLAKSTKKGEDGTAKYTKEQLANELDMSVQHVGNMARAALKICDEVKEAIRTSTYRDEIAARTLFAWAAMTPEEQHKAFKKWESLQERIAAEGKKRANKSEGEGEGEGEGPKKDKLVTKAGIQQMQHYKSVAEFRLEHAKGVAEKARYETIVGVLAFFSGEKKRLDVLTGEDFREYKAYVAAEEKRLAAEEQEAKELAKAEKKANREADKALKASRKVTA